MKFAWVCDEGVHRWRYPTRFLRSIDSGRSIYSRFALADSSAKDTSSDILAASYRVHIHCGAITIGTACVGSIHCALVRAHIFRISFIRFLVSGEADTGWRIAGRPTRSRPTSTFFSVRCTLGPPLPRITDVEASSGRSSNEKPRGRTSRVRE